MRIVFAKRQLILVGAVAFLSLTLADMTGCTKTDARPSSDGSTQHHAVSAYLERNADSLDASLVALASAAQLLRAAPTNDSASVDRVRAVFLQSRTHYKHLEAVIEFYAPSLAAALNSRRQEVDDDDAPPPSSLAPSGYPAIEAMLWADNGNISQLDTIIGGMRRVVKNFRDLGAALSPTDAQLIELARLELTRISTLSIAGFDTPLTLRATSESADAIVGVQMLFADAGPEHWPQLRAERTRFDSELQRAFDYLKAHSDFEQFDRLAFIVGYAIPTAHALDEIRQKSGTVAIGMKRGWRADAASVYDSGAFDSRAYAADDASVSSAPLIALGERLFSETALSGNGARACSSCHQPSHAFTDGLSRATRIDGKGLIARHTPTLLNAALSPAQFADERAITLEEQVQRVIESPTEMAGSLEQSVARVKAKPEYLEMIAQAFGARSSGRDDTNAGVSSARIRYALAAYVRALEAMNSRFDRAIRGDTAQLTTIERRGFNLFMGRAGCGTCHFAPLFNGNTPPLYLSADVEVIGVPAHPNSPSNTDADSGRAAIDGLPLHYRAFKTPTVRNASHTAPFMHNGVFQTLDAVLRFYSDGGGSGAGANIGNQTLGANHLNLTASERDAIVAFIGSLSDTATHASMSSRGAR